MEPRVETPGISALPSGDGFSLGLEALQKKIRYPFNERAHLIQAMTHTSYGHEYLQSRGVGSRDNERLEFLGDAILDVVVSDMLLEAFPNDDEGRLSKKRAALVNEKTLAETALIIGIDQNVRLGKGESRTGGSKKPSILACTLEALIAAIYLDGGFNAVYPVVRFLFQPLFRSVLNVEAYSDHKTLLQEQVQAKWKVTPTYHLIRASGPDHAKSFEVEVRMGEKVLGHALGPSKKEAEQNAARAALQQLPTPAVKENPPEKNT